MLSDITVYLIRDVGPAVFLLGFVVGAVSLWKRTRLIPALVQLLAASVLFVNVTQHSIRTNLTTPFDTSAFARAWWSEAMGIAESVILVVGAVAFVAGYLWYAHSNKRI